MRRQTIVISVRMIVLIGLIVIEALIARERTTRSRIEVVNADLRRHNKSVAETLVDFKSEQIVANQSQIDILESELGK